MTFIDADYPFQAGADRLLTPDEVADRLQVPRSTVLYLTRAKKLPCVHLSREIMRYHWPTILKAKMRGKSLKGLLLLAFIFLSSVHGVAGEPRTGVRVTPNETHRAIQFRSVSGAVGGYIPRPPTGILHGVVSHDARGPIQFRGQFSRPLAGLRDCCRIQAASFKAQSPASSLATSESRDSTINVTYGRIAPSSTLGIAGARLNAASGVAIFAVLYGAAVMYALYRAAREHIKHNT